jgi:hypothetical protein
MKVMETNPTALRDVVSERGVMNFQGTEDLPQVLQYEIKILQKWRQTMTKKIRLDKLGFWIFKVTAILASISAGVVGMLGLLDVALVLSLFAAVCVAVDGFRPRGMLCKVHQTADRKIQQLEETIRSRWVGGNLTGHGNTAKELVAGILKEAYEGKERISKYLEDGETYLASGEP